MNLNVERFSAVIDSVATSQFYPNVVAYLESFFAFDRAIAYTFEPGSEPRCVMASEFENNQAVSHIYQAGAYLQDPFYQALQGSHDNKVLALHDLVSSGFYRTAYYRNFYCKTGWRDETAVLFPLGQLGGLGIFLGSDCQRVELRYRNMPDLTETLSLMKNMVNLHRNVLPATAGDKHDEASPKPVAGRNLLTRRECEIVDLILVGKGSPQIAQHLFISLGTVKNHRKNIYHKLNISSQAELFNYFMNPPVHTPCVSSVT